jgi:hypothetical protein
LELLLVIVNGRSKNGYVALQNKNKARFWFVPVYSVPVLSISQYTLRVCTSLA